MNENDPPLSINWGAVSRAFGIKMGPGIMGRATQLAALVVVFGTVSIWAIRESAWAPALFLAPLIVVIYIIHRAFNFAEKHPNSALLESTELLRKEEIDQKAKHLEIIDAQAQPVTNASAPQAISNECGDDV